MSQFTHPGPYVPRHSATAPRQRRAAGLALGILSLVLFFTGPLATSLGFVSNQQSRRAGGTGLLGAIGFIIGIAVSLIMAAYIFSEVKDIWDRLP